MDLASERHISLDRIGARVLTGLRAPVAPGRLCGTLAAEDVAPAAVIERDVLAQVAALADRKLIQVEP